MGVLSNEKMVNKINNIKREAGQGMIEFLVAAMFVLVPMGIGLTYVAKVSHTQHKMHEAARYAAFEKEKWPGGVGHSKSNSQMALEINRRIFSSGDEVIDSVEDVRNVTLSSLNKVNPFMKHSYRNNYNPLITNNQVRLSSTLSPMNSNVMSVINGVVGRGLSLGRSGIQTTTVGVDLQKLAMLPLPSSTLTSTSHVALLSNAWNASGPGDVIRRVQGTVPTSVFSGSLFNTMRSIAGVLFPEFNTLDPGHVAPDTIPCDRMSTC